MLVGKTKIELFDAKTGAKLNSVEKKNLVTNAVKNVINGMNQAALISVGNTYGFKEVPSWLLTALRTDPYKKLYGGLMVFGEQVAENANHMIPSIDEMRSYIGGGYQGGSIAGSNLGTLNTDESEVTDTYAKFVWDFTTSQCNGNIACICLTSNVGGYGGLGIKSSADTGRIVSFLRPAGFSNFFDISNSTSVPDRRRLAQNGDGASNWRGMDDDYVYYINGGTYRFGINPGSMRQSIFKELIRTFSASEKIYDTDLYQNGYSFVTSFDKGKLYAFNWNGGTRLYDASTNAITTYASNFSGVKDELNSFIGSTNIGNVKCKFVKGGYFYLVTYNTSGASLSDKKIKVFKINPETGSYSSHTIQLTSSDLDVVVPDNSVTSSNKTAYMQMFDGEFIADIAGTGCYTHIDLSNYTIYAIYRQYVYASEDGKAPTFFERGTLPEPWVLLPFANWSSDIFAPYMFMPYLATINNQEIVLTKDNTKTMKISYTIYEEQEGA